MNTKQKTINAHRLNKALNTLELLSEDGNQELLATLDDASHLHLQELSRKEKRSPFRLKKNLEELKEAGLVFSPKRFPKAYASNRYKRVKIAMQVRNL